MQPSNQARVDAHGAFLQARQDGDPEYLATNAALTAAYAKDVDPLVEAAQAVVDEYTLNTEHPPKICDHCLADVPDCECNMGKLRAVLTGVRDG